MSTTWTATVAHATSNVQAFATAADRAGIAYAAGDVTYLIDVKQFQFWDGAAWQTLASGGGGVSFPLTDTASAAASTVEYQTRVTSDTQYRFQIQTDGQ